jgi:hypothetical protein
MHLINVAQMSAVISHIVVGEDEPCMFWGEPGCGKTEGIMAVAKELDADVVDIRLGQYDSVDLRGFPGVDPISNTTVWHMPSTLPFVGNPKFDPDRKKIIFFDEANAAKPATSGVAYQLVQERRVGEHVLQPNTFICAAGNRESDRGVVNKQPKPLSNRFTHFGVGPDADVWCMWAASQERIPGELIAFLQFRKPLITTFDPESPEKAFATPRTWEKAGHYFSNGAIPEDMISIAQIEKDPEGVPVPDRAEVLYAVTVGISGALEHKNSKPLNTFLKRLAPEFSILAWQLAIRRNRQLVGCPEFIEISKLYRSIFAQS